EDHAGRRLALKAFRAAAPSPREARELDALRRCDRPHILESEDVGTVTVEGREHRFVAERFVDGGSLTQRLGPRGLLRPLEAASCRICSPRNWWRFCASPTYSASYRRI